MTAEEKKILRAKLWLGWRLLRSLGLFLADEYRRGTLKENLRSIGKAKGLSLARDMSHAELLEEKAAKLGEQPVPALPRPGPELPGHGPERQPRGQLPARAGREAPGWAWPSS